MAIRILPQPIDLLDRELSDLRQAIATALPAQARAGERIAQVSLLGQPFFAHHRICEAQLALEGGASPRRVHYAQAPNGALLVLTAHLANLQAVAAAEPPALPDLDAALAFANFGDLWTTHSEQGELLLKSLDDIPWLTELHPGERALIDNLHKTHGDHVHPPKVTQEGDCVIVSQWLLIRCALLRRELRVTLAGHLTRSDELLENDLPVLIG